MINGSYAHTLERSFFSISFFYVNIFNSNLLVLLQLQIRHVWNKGQSMFMFDADNCIICLLICTCAEKFELVSKTLLSGSLPHFKKTSTNVKYAFVLWCFFFLNEFICKKFLWKKNTRVVIVNLEETFERNKFEYSIGKLLLISVRT